MAKMLPNNRRISPSNLGECYRDDDPAVPSGFRVPESHSRDVPLHEANRSHDQAHGNPHKWSRIRSGWIVEMLMRGDLLTDESIAKWRRLGYFTDAHKEAIRELVRKKNEGAGRRYAR